MTESQILTLNERIKGVATYFFNLSAALMAATAARVWVRASPDSIARLWLAVAIGLLLIANKVLYLLEPEMENFK